MDDPPYWYLGSPISINGQGGFYKNGKAYSSTKKWEVAVVFVWLWEDNWPTKPTNMVSLARKAGVSPRYVRKVLEELTVTGCL
jgi:hypothetical protein